MPIGADACRDPDDLLILGTAVAARMDCLASDQKDLPALKEFNTRPIMVTGIATNCSADRLEDPIARRQ